MDRRTLIEFIASWILILCSGGLMILPIFNIVNVKIVFIFIISLYGIIHLVKNFLTIYDKNYAGFRIAISCIIILILLIFFDISDSPWNLALMLFIWIILISLTKLKEIDYYHDRKNKLWKLNIVNLILFIITGVLTTINLYYTGDIQILVLGFFFLINGILELMNPLVTYIINIKK